MIVVDTNTLVYLFLPTSLSDAAEKQLLDDPHWVAPVLWRSEFRNVLAGYLRNNRLSLDKARKVQKLAEEFLLGCEYSVPSEDVLELVAATSCSAYDCEFVALAKSLGAPLVTMDKQVIREFPEVARPLIE